MFKQIKIKTTGICLVAYMMMVSGSPNDEEDVSGSGDSMSMSMSDFSSSYGS